MWWQKRKKQENNPFSLRDKHQRFYQTGEWQHIRMHILSVYPCCTECEKVGLVEPSTIVDHIESLTTAWHRRLDPDNLTGLCVACHNKKSRSERTEYEAAERQKVIDDKMSELGHF